MIFEGVAHQGVVVPQKEYTSPAARNFIPQAPIGFCVNGVLGVRLEDALRPNQPILGWANGNLPLTLAVASTRLTLRILVYEHHNIIA